MDTVDLSAIKFLIETIMKTVQTVTLEIATALLLMLFVLPACSESEKNGQEATTNNIPEVDIHTAVIQGDLDAVKQHIDAGSDINIKEPMGGSTPLITAVTFNHYDIAKALVDAGADLSLKNNDGSTPLHAAAFFCRKKMVQMLLAANADKTTKNNYNATPREIVMAPFEAMKPAYEMIQVQLGPLGIKIDMDYLERTRPLIADMLR
ncbi:MAG: ankyrin repeat domain-containing protein [Flavobacteriales bacterium]|nr:ankyrin repeat domain-containing protein [Flavobacteriales bacterium]